MRVLCTVWNFPGCAHPFFAVSKHLQRRGHEVGFYTGAAYRDTARAEGWGFFPFQTAIERLVEEKVFSSNSIGANWNKPWRVPSLLKEFFVDSIPAQLEDLHRILVSWRPHAILCDPAMFAPFLILHETTGVPVTLLSYVLGCMIPGPEIPPPGLGLPLPGGPVQRAWNTLVGKVADWRLDGLRREANRHRRSHGLVPVEGSVVHLTARLPLYLITSCPELDYPRSDLPPNVRYVGGCFWYPPMPTPRWVEDLSGDPPCVYVNEGTIHVASPFVLEAAVKGLAHLPIRVVLTTGLHRELAQLGGGSLPSNVLSAPWINHDVLMSRVQAMVCTGGPGTVLAALSRGVPMVVVPTEWDHPENAQRLVAAGVAVRIPPSRCTPRRLGAAVMRLLEDPTYRLNAERCASALKRRGGAGEAARLLESTLVGRDQPSQRWQEPLGSR